MSRLKFPIGRGVVLATMLMLAACSSSPAIIDSTQAASADGEQSAPVETVQTSHEEVAANESGLGTIIYVEATQRECKKHRRTGSRIRRSSCDNSSGSFAVKTVNYEESHNAPTVPVGASSRPTID